MKLNIEQFNPCRDGYDYYNGFSTFEKFWNKCYRGDWMLWLADQLEIDRRTLVRAAALCANKHKIYRLLLRG
jgi:predicted acetyltransferase